LHNTTHLDFITWVCPNKVATGHL